MVKNLEKFELGVGRPKTHAAISAWRREQLIVAALHCVAEGGIQYATVEEVTARAQVSRGLVRHYFRNKNDMILEAYRYLCDLFTNNILSQNDAGHRSPMDRILFLVRFTFEREFTDKTALSCWFSFWAEARTNASLRVIYNDYYAWYRSYLSGLISQYINLPEGTQRVDMAVDGFVALTDGLWLEISIDPERVSPDYAVAICKSHLRNLDSRETYVELHPKLNH